MSKSDLEKSRPESAEINGIFKRIDTVNIAVSIVEQAVDPRIVDPTIIQGNRSTSPSAEQKQIYFDTNATQVEQILRQVEQIHQGRDI